MMRVIATVSKDPDDLYSRPFCVWLIDDDPDDQLIFTEAMERAHPDVQLRLLDGYDDAKATAECRAKADALVPGLILLDLNMPRVQGIEVLQFLRSIPTMKHVPIVISTTSGSDTDREQALAMGADDFISKPMSFHELVEVLKPLIQHWKDKVTSAQP